MKYILLFLISAVFIFEGIGCGSEPVKEPYEGSRRHYQDERRWKSGEAEKDRAEERRIREDEKKRSRRDNLRRNIEREDSRNEDALKNDDGY